MKLNIWNYIVIGTKAVFGGVPSVVCYLANLLNEKSGKSRSCADACFGSFSLGCQAGGFDL